MEGENIIAGIFNRSVEEVTAERALRKLIAYTGSGQANKIRPNALVEGKKKSVLQIVPGAV